MKPFDEYVPNGGWIKFNERRQRKQQLKKNVEKWFVSFLAAIPFIYIFLLLLEIASVLDA